MCYINTIDTDIGIPFNFFQEGEKHSEAISMLEESSQAGCLQSSYLLWEHNRKAAVSIKLLFSILLRHTLRKHWPYWLNFFFHFKLKRGVISLKYLKLVLKWNAEGFTEPINVSLNTCKKPFQAFHLTNVAKSRRLNGFFIFEFQMADPGRYLQCVRTLRDYAGKGCWEAQVCYCAYCVYSLLALCLCSVCVCVCVWSTSWLLFLKGAI